jgi:tetratricopeptide (TPR) repeat protein
LKKKILLLAGLGVLAAFQAAVVWNGRLWWTGSAVATDPAEKVRILRRAEAVFPWNDAVAFELGKAYFESASEALDDPAARDRSFGLAVEAFLRSLRLDPGRAATHFHLAQTLLYMSYLSLPAPVTHFEEYTRAARLTGHHSQIFFDVGKVLLGRWPSLSAEERDFAVEVLRRSLAGRDEKRLAEILETWRLEVRDYGLIGRVLPEDAATLRAYARFLGEKALSLEERHAALARAERLEFERAKGELDEGRRESEAYRPAEASVRYRAALEALEGIRFYQRLAGRELVDPREYDEVRRAALRLLAMGRVDQTRSLVDEDGAIAAYLASGDTFAALGEFERFLKERGLLADAPTAASPFQDLATLALRMDLDFQLNRYRDIVRAGDLLAASSVVVAPSGRPSYARILRLAGEAHLKLDNVYEAERYFLMTLEVDPESLEALLGLERCYGRLNDGAKAAEVGERIGRQTGPDAIDLGGRSLAKGESFSVDLLSDGRPATLRFGFEPDPPGGTPLAAVFLNGRIAWEGPAKAGGTALPVDLAAGRNSVVIEAVGGPLRLTSILRGRTP